MAGFKFRLARVLVWYRKQGQLAEDRLRAAIAELTRTEEAIAHLRESREKVERGIIEAVSVDASELAALHSYREGTRRQELAMEQSKSGINKRIIEHRTRVTALRTRIRLLEKLADRRLGEHVVAEERELEELAADAFRSASFHARVKAQ
jgi:hypothetical protein